MDQILKFLKEFHEDVCDESLCASYRRNLTQWRGSRPTKLMKNSSQVSKLKGKTLSKQTAYSWAKPKARTVEEEFIRVLPTFSVIGRVCFWMIVFLISSDISRLRQTSWTNMQPRKKQTSHVKLSVETITETWFSRKKLSDE